MRKHRRFEKVSKLDITVQMRVASPRDLMNLVKEDVDIEVKARSGAYSNGSSAYPIPRTMDISRFSRMSRPAHAPAPAPAPAPVPVPAPTATE